MSLVWLTLFAAGVFLGSYTLLAPAGGIAAFAGPVRRGKVPRVDNAEARIEAARNLERGSFWQRLWAGLELRGYRSGLTGWGAARFLALAGAGVALFFWGGYLWTGNFWAALFLAPAGYIVPDLWLEGKTAKARQKYALAVESLIENLANLFRLKNAVPQALTAAAWEAEEPLKSDLGWVLARYAAGTPVGKSLAEAAWRRGNRDLFYLAAAVELSEMRGGDLAKVVSGLAADVGARKAARAERKAETAGGTTLNLIMLAALPVLYTLIRRLMPVLSESLTETGIGQFGVVFMAATITAQLLILRYFTTLRDAL